MVNKLISIVMPVYNGAKYIGETIESVLKQNYSHFELIVVDDASTDNTFDVVNSYTDPRIKILRNETNRRLAYSLNKAISESKGDYIARLDADDICLPNRFILQINFLENNPSIGVVGGWAKQFGGASRLMKYPRDSKKICALMFFQNPFCHPTIMFRRTLINEWYDSQVIASQDYELWSRLVGKVEFANIQQPLIKYRVHENQTRNLLGIKQKEGAEKALKKMLQICNIDSTTNISLIKQINLPYVGYDLTTLSHIGNLLDEIQKKLNKEIFDTTFFKKEARKRTALLISSSCQKGKFKIIHIFKIKFWTSLCLYPKQLIKTLIGTHHV